MWIPVITILWALGDNATWVNFPMVNFQFWYSFPVWKMWLKTDFNDLMSYQSGIRIFYS
jgi:hypothetical protein